MLSTFSVIDPDALAAVTTLNATCATLTRPVGASWFVWKALKRVEPVVNELGFVVGSAANWLVPPPVIEETFTAAAG